MQEPLNHQIHADATELNIPVNVVDTPPLCDFIFPAIIDRNPIVIGISSNGKAPVLARLLRARLETLIPQGYGKLAKLAGDFRSEVKAKIPTLTGRRQFWERAFEGQVSQLMFSGNDTQAVRRYGCCVFCRRTLCPHHGGTDPILAARQVHRNRQYQPAASNAAL